MQRGEFDNVAESSDEVDEAVGGFVNSDHVRVSFYIKKEQKTISGVICHVNNVFRVTK